MDPAEAFREMQDEYAALLPGYADELQAAIAAASPNAVLYAHRLAGTAGSYGFRGVSSVASRLERALETGGDVNQAWQDFYNVIASVPTGGGR